jgi:hypothetical protein
MSRPPDAASETRRSRQGAETGESNDFRKEWLVEAKKRAEELDRGDVAPVPAEDVFRKARALLR